LTSELYNHARASAICHQGQQSHPIHFNEILMTLLSLSYTSAAIFVGMRRMTAYRGGTMKANAAFRVEIGVIPAVVENKFRSARRRWLKCLLTSCIAAAVTGIFGLVLSAASMLGVISAVNRLTSVGVILLVATFPILVFAAHCLDRIDDANREIRLAAYRKKRFQPARTDQ
jgi:hypothetical protein